MDNIKAESLIKKKCLKVLKKCMYCALFFLNIKIKLPYHKRLTEPSRSIVMRYIT